MATGEKDFAAMIFDMKRLFLQGEMKRDTFIGLTQQDPRVSCVRVGQSRIFICKRLG